MPSLTPRPPSQRPRVALRPQAFAKRFEGHADGRVAEAHFLGGRAREGLLALCREGVRLAEVLPRALDAAPVKLVELCDDAWKGAGAPALPCAAFQPLLGHPPVQRRVVELLWAGQHDPRAMAGLVAQLRNARPDGDVLFDVVVRAARPRDALVALGARPWPGAPGRDRWVCLHAGARAAQCDVCGLGLRRLLRGYLEADYRPAEVDSAVVKGLEVCRCAPGGTAAPAVRSLGDRPGTGGGVPFANRIFEWGEAIATFWSALSIVPRFIVPV